MSSIPLILEFVIIPGTVVVGIIAGAKNRDEIVLDLDLGHPNWLLDWKSFR